DVPPRTVANSDKEKIRLSQTTNPESSNPALTPTANARTWHPGTNPNHYPYNLTLPTSKPKPTSANETPPNDSNRLPLDNLKTHIEHVRFLHAFQAL
ncbi:hypothetical protein ABH944_008770, partial [Caballeronia udeis]